VSQPNDALVELRAQLYAFAQQCEKKLQKNDHKTEWVKLPVKALLEKLKIEVRELEVALEYEGPAESMNECVDVANFAMMLWDRLGHEQMFAKPVMAPKNVFTHFPDAKPGELVQVEIEQTTAGPRFKYTPTPATHLMPSDASEEVKYQPSSDNYATTYTGSWARHGTWMDGNVAIAKMYRNTPAGGGSVIFYEDVPEARERKLRIVPKHVAEALDV
jgi:hypothetical protein